MSNLIPTVRSPTDQILLTLKTRGPQETLGVATALGVSRQAALQALERRANRGVPGLGDRVSRALQILREQDRK